MKDLPGVLHIRIIAPFDVRIQRIIDKGKGGEKQAAEILRRSDRNSAGFIRAYFDVDWDDQTLYDLIINTRKLSVDSGARMILESISSPEIKEGEKKAEEKLADLALVQKVESSLVDILGTDLRHISIQAERGVLALGGTVASESLKNDCQKAVARIEGVNRVDNELSVASYYGYGGG